MQNVTLYGKDKKDSYKVWHIAVFPCEDGTASILIQHGKEDGKLQDKVETVTAGKQGRNAYEQAVSQAESRINKQKDKGYRETKAELEELPLAAMLAEDYHDQGHRILYPCYESAKLDGVRCLMIRTEDGLKLQSRGNKLYNVPHLHEYLLKAMKPGEVWDGEIYVHGYELEDILSAVKRTDPDKEIAKCTRKVAKLEKAHETALKEYGEASAKTGLALEEAQAELVKAHMIKGLRAKLQFVVFDVVNEKPFSERLNDLANVTLRTSYGEWAYTLDYTIVHNEEEMKLLHANYVDLGYEGIMLRNFNGLYESGKRSADLQKYKTFMDREFIIVDVVADKNGNAVFICFDELAGATFGCCYGDFAQRKYQLEHAELYVLRYLTVSFQKRYKDSRLPQFPTGKLIRAGEMIDGEFFPED